MEMEKAIDGFAKISKILLEKERKEPVLKYHGAKDYEKLVNLSLKNDGCTESEFFKLLEQISLLTPRTNSKSFFNQLFAGRTGPSLSADLLATLLNTTMHTYKVAGIQVLIEKEVTDAFLEKVGYENGEGIMNPGGSLSNLASMIVARNEKDASILKEGYKGQKFIVYTSAESHYSVIKNAGMLGLGRNNVRKIESDYIGRMDSTHLEAEIKKDLSKGNVPFYINATAGTTVLGAYDQFKEASDIAKKYNLWLHIDGALGGSALLSTKHKHLLEGSELSDSFTWNAHKMMNVPVCASFLLVKKKGLLGKHFSEKADYLFQGESADLDLGNISMQCGRRVDAFKVWAAWKYYGLLGLERKIDHLFDLAEYAASCVEQEPIFELFRSPESVNVCFTIEGVEPEKVCDYLHKKGLIMVGYSQIKGTTFIRMACINAEIQKADVDHFFEQVKVAVEALRR
jgi:glutamate/tyrosine decarboxylase-like PLP-dependent enzyme